MKRYSTSRNDFLVSKIYCDKIRRDARRIIGKTANSIVLGALLMTMSLSVRGQLADAFNPNLDNGVLDIQRQSDGKILIGGFFSSVGGQTHNRLARLNADGTLDTTFANVSINQPVYAIAIQPDGKVLVGINSLNTPSETLNQLFRFNADGTSDTSFNANVNKGVYVIALQNDGKIIISGNFTNISGQARSNLARLNSDGTLDTSFTLTPDVYIKAAVRQPDGKILIGGLFSNINGSPRNRIARLNADGTLDTAFNSLTVSYTGGQGVDDIAVQPDGKIIIGGYPSNDGSIKSLARLGADGTPDTAFNQNVEPFYDVRLGSNINARAVAVQSNGKILFGGSRSPRDSGFIRLNADGTTDLAFNPHPTFLSPYPGLFPDNFSSVSALLVLPDQKILVGGGFTRIGGATRNNFARLLSDSRSVPAIRFDFDGDTRADVSAFRPSNGTWYIYQSASVISPPNIGLKIVAFGIASDRLAPADYDGDFKTDVAVFREGSLGYFYILDSRTNTFRYEQFGMTGDIPIAGDFDGDNKADVAVYRNGSAAGAQSYFYYRPTATAGIDFRTIAWGAAGDKPLIGDFDGDGKQDPTVFRPSNGVWYVLRSSDNQLQAAQFGIASDKLVAADYDGDLKTDYAVFRSGIWYLQRSQLGFTAIPYGLETDVPTPADYNGDGNTDVGVFRNGIWHLNNGAGGAYSTATDKPIPNAFVQ